MNFFNYSTTGFKMPSDQYVQEVKREVPVVENEEMQAVQNENPQEFRIS